jgi:predicted membrane protein
MLASLLVPLFTGGIFAIILVLQAQYLFVAPVLLVFYGLALTSSSRFAHRELFSMGIIQIILGLAAVWFPLYGLFFWACGFGIVHIIYGILMYLKYEVTTKNTR